MNAPSWHSKPVTRNYVAALAVIVVALSVAMKVYSDHVANGIKATARAVAQKLYTAQIASCDRGNILRVESNRRIAAHLTDRDNLVEFADAARNIRLVAYQQTHDPYDLKAAKLYLKITHQERAIRFDPVTVVDCKKAILRP